MADSGGLLEVGRVHIKVWPDLDPFERGLRTAVNKAEKRHKVDVPVHADADRLTNEVRTARRIAQRRAGDVEIDVSLDYDRIGRSIQRVNSMLRDLESTTIHVGYDTDSLKGLREELSALRTDSTIELEVVEDLESLRAARARIQSALRDREKFTIDVDADPESLRQMLDLIDERMSELTPDQTITLDPEVDRDGLRRSLRRVQDAIRDLDYPPIEVEMDRESLVRARRNLQDMLAERPIEIEYNADEEGYRDALRRVNEMIREQEREIKFIPENDPEALRRVRDDFQDIVDRYDDKKIELQAQAETLKARAELARTARTRIVTMIVNVNKASITRANATLAALSGLRFLDRALHRIWDNFKNIDKNIVIIGTIAEAVAGLTAWLLAAASNTFSLSRSLAQIGGLGLLLPGILGGMAVGLGATVAVMKDALNVVPELGDMFRDLQDSMSFRFWSRFEQPFRQAIDTLFPEFASGMEGTATALSIYFSNMADSARRHLSGSMTHMFERLTESILISAQGSEDFMSIIGILGRRGADVLPRLARWWNDIANTFNNWLINAERSGRLDEIIETAISNARDLGWVVYHLSGALSGLARAAAEAGGATLESLAAKLERIHRAIDRPAFQEGLTRALRAAHDAMDRISTQSGPRVTSFFENLSFVMERGFKDVGDAIGLLVGGLAEAFSTQGFSHGLLDFLRGLREGIESLNRMWTPLGDGLGAFGSLLGTIGREFGPLLAELLIHLSGLLQRLGPYMEAWVRSLSGRLLGVLQAVSPLVLNLVEALARLIDPLIRMPGLIEFVALAFGTWKLHGIVSGLRELITTATGMSVFRGAAAYIAAFWRTLDAAGKATAIGLVVTAIGGLIYAFRDLAASNTQVVAQDLNKLSYEMERAIPLLNNAADGWSYFGKEVRNGPGLTAKEQLDGFVDGLTSAGTELTNTDALMRNLGFASGDLETEIGFLGRTWHIMNGNMERANAGIAPLSGEMDQATEAAANLDQAMAEQIRNGNLYEVTSYLGELGAAAQRAGLSADYMHQAFPNAMTAVAEGEEELAAYRSATLNAGAAQDFLNDTIDGFGTATPRLIGAIQEGAQGFYDITGAISEVDSAFSELSRSPSLSDYADALEQQVDDQRVWANNITRLAAAGVDEGVLNHLARLGPEGRNLINAMGDELDGGSREAINRIEQAVRDQMEGPQSAMEGEFAEMVEAAKRGFSNLSPEVKSMIQDMEPEAVAAMTPYGLAMMEGLSDGMEEGEAGARDTATQMASGVDASFAERMGIESPSKVFHAHGVDIMQGLIDGLRSMLAAVLAALGGIITSILGRFSNSGTLLYQRGRDIIRGLTDGMRSRNGNVRGQANTSKNLITDSFKNSGSLLYGRGDNIISGLASGMRRANGKVRSAGSSARAAARSPFGGAGSWLYGIGQSIIAGLARGMSSMLGTVRSIARQASAAARTASNAARAAANSGAKARQAAKPPPIVSLSLPVSPEVVPLTAGTFDVRNDFVAQNVVTDVTNDLARTLQGLGDSFYVPPMPTSTMRSMANAVDYTPRAAAPEGPRRVVVQIGGREFEGYMDERVDAGLTSVNHYVRHGGDF